MKPLRILFFDLETAPLLAHVWRPDDRWIPSDRMLHDSFLLTWGAKWSHEKKVRSGVLTPDEATAQDDRRIVTELADLIREADILVAHNATRFDLPMFNNRLLVSGLEPLGRVRVIDTLSLARRNFRLSHNNLDYLGDLLGVGRKIKTDFDLWRKAYHGDEKALSKMRRYNRQDVLLLEAVFEKMKPYVNNLPRLYDAEHGGELACPFCGSADLIKRGYHRTQASTFTKVQCQTCRRYSRYRTTDSERKPGVHPL